jgi:hypothetical protein
VAAAKKPKKVPADKPKPRRRPAATPEAREQQLTGLAYDLAERRLRDGSATSQEVTHFLRAGSGREELERVKIQHENELTKAKIEAIENQVRSDELFLKAMEAMSLYKGHDAPEEEYYDED